MWGIKLKFSDPLMADISRSFCFFFCVIVKLKQKQCQNDVRLLEIWKFLNRYLFNSKGGNFVNKWFWTVILLV